MIPPSLDKLNFKSPSIRKLFDNKADFVPKFTTIYNQRLATIKPDSMLSPELRKYFQQLTLIKNKLLENHLISLSSQSINLDSQSFFFIKEDYEEVCKDLSLSKDLSLRDLPVEVLTEYNIKLKASRLHATLLERCIQKRLPFDLTLNDCLKLLNRKTCFYTKEKINPSPSTPKSRSIDRIDCSKGYIKGNVVACTAQINLLKNELFENINSSHKIDLKQLTNLVTKLNSLDSSIGR